MESLLWVKKNQKGNTPRRRQNYYYYNSPSPRIHLFFLTTIIQISGTLDYLVGPQRLFVGNYLLG